MAVLLNVYQDNRKNSNKLFYGRTYCPNIISTRENAADGRMSGLSSRSISGTGFSYKIVDLAEKPKKEDDGE